MRNFFETRTKDGKVECRCYYDKIVAVREDDGNAVVHLDGGAKLYFHGWTLDRFLRELMDPHDKAPIVDPATPK